jgi:hypothetical protein
MYTAGQSLPNTNTGAFRFPGKSIAQYVHFGNYLRQFAFNFGSYAQYPCSLRYG